MSSDALSITALIDPTDSRRAFLLRTQSFLTALRQASPTLRVGEAVEGVTAGARTTAIGIARASMQVSTTPPGVDLYRLRTHPF